MAKGKTNQPLVIWVWHPWISRTEIGALADAGHTLVAISREGSLLNIAGESSPDYAPDLILHPAAHAWDDELWDYLDIAIKAARARRRNEKARAV